MQRDVYLSTVNTMRAINAYAVSILTYSECGEMQNKNLLE
jgi:hypothetical protein